MKKRTGKYYEGRVSRFRRNRRYHMMKLSLRKEPDNFETENKKA
jgi:hypothetical protein